MQLQDKTVVYKVVDGKAVSALITVAGINDGREYVVLDGLEVGDEIVSTGAGLLRECNAASVQSMTRDLEKLSVPAERQVS